MSIKPINTLIGQAARGGKYFPRTNITDEIWRKLGDGSNLLFVAPRRVGKSSILFHLFDNPKGNLPVVYYISESVNNENEFYRKLFHHVLEKMGTLQKYQAVFKTWAKNLPSYVESIGPEGIRFRPGSPVSYYEELLTFVKEKMTHDHPMLVLIDEFASTVENIAQDEGDRAAIHFLETKRSLRQEPEVQDKLRFIYAGSIGLENNREQDELCKPHHGPVSCRCAAFDEARSGTVDKKHPVPIGYCLRQRCVRPFACRY